MREMSVAWVFLALLCGVLADDDIRFQLRHREALRYPPNINAYVGQPPRVQPIRLTWSPPGDAAYPDDPPVYRAFWVETTHVLAGQEDVRLLSRDNITWLKLQTMAVDDDPATALRLYLGHNSILYQRWPFLTLTYDMLHLTADRFHAPLTRSLVWPCEEFDTSHRCVVRNVTLNLVYSRAGANRAFVVDRVVLDWESAQSQLPVWMYGGLKRANVPGDTLLGVRLRDNWLVTDADIVIDDTEPVAALGISNDTLVLGRRMLWRTFNLFAYDAEASEWTLHQALPSYSFWSTALEVSLLLSGLFLCFHATGLYMLMMDKIVGHPVADMAIFEPSSLGIWDQVVILASSLVAVFQLVVSVVITGSGTYTDYDLATAFWRLAWVLVAVGGWHVLWGLVFYGINQRQEPSIVRGMLHIMGHATYIKLVLLGTIAALLPASVQSKYFLSIACVIMFLFVIPSFAYTTFSLFAVAAAPKGGALVWWAGAVELMATLALTAGTVVYLYRPMLYQHQVLRGEFAVWCLAVTGGILGLIFSNVLVYWHHYKDISQRKLKKM
jgi:hypothetical protein